MNNDPWNPWGFEGDIAEGSGVGPDQPGYRPFRERLLENSGRHRRPLFIVEADLAATRVGADIAGLYLYPILKFTGWDDGPGCRDGLRELPDESGHRPIHEPLAIELERLGRPLSRGDRLALAGGPPSPAVACDSPNSKDG